MMYTAYKSNKQGDNIQPWRTPFSVWSQSTVPCIHTAKLQRQWGWPSSSQVTQFLWPSVRLNLVLPWGWWDEWDLSACFSFWSSFRTRECPRILLGSWTKDELQRDQVNYPRSHWKPVGWVLPRSPDDAHPPPLTPPAPCSSLWSMLIGTAAQWGVGTPTSGLTPLSLLSH